MYTCHNLTHKCLQQILIFLLFEQKYLFIKMIHPIIYIYTLPYTIGPIFKIQQNFVMLVAAMYVMCA